MKTRKVIKLPASTVEKLIKDLSLLVVSMDHIGSAYCDDPTRQAIEIERYFSKVKAFKILARVRGVLSDAYGSQSSKADALRLEQNAENLPYWRPTKEHHKDNTKP